MTIDAAPIALDGPELTAGFYAREGEGPASWRWTNGDATLVLPPHTTQRVLEVAVAFTAKGRQAA